MTMIYNPIPFVKFIQKFVGNCEPIVGCCAKIFVIRPNLHNLQMLFMLWIKNNFSECLALLNKHEGPQWKTFWRRFCPGPQTQGDIRWKLPPNIASAPPNFVVIRKFCFKHMILTKISPPKNVCCTPKPQNLATGLVLPKLCLQLGYFVLKAIRPRDAA